MKKKLLIIIVIAGLVGGLIVAYLLIYKKQKIISNEVMNQITYVVMIPDSANYKIPPESINYNSVEKILSFTANSPDGMTQLTFTEQPTPDTFVDIPQYYEKLIEAMNSYRQVDTANGKVALTKPEELKGGQTAVLNQKGTLIFVRPSKDLDDEVWRRLFNGLKEYN